MCEILTRISCFVDVVILVDVSVDFVDASLAILSGNVIFLIAWDDDVSWFCCCCFVCEMLLFTRNNICCPPFM